MRFFFAFRPFASFAFRPFAISGFYLGLLLWVLLLVRVGKLVVKAVCKLAYEEVLVAFGSESKASKALKGFIYVFVLFNRTLLIFLVSYRRSRSYSAAGLTAQWSNSVSGQRKALKK